jgi:hypothetical protein
LGPFPFTEKEIIIVSAKSLKILLKSSFQIQELELKKVVKFGFWKEFTQTNGGIEKSVWWELWLGLTIAALGIFKWNILTFKKNRSTVKSTFTIQRFNLGSTRFIKFDKETHQLQSQHIKLLL